MCFVCFNRKTRENQFENPPKTHRTPPENLRTTTDKHMKKKPFHFGHGKTVLAIHKRQSPPIASLFATAPIDAGPNSKCGISRDYFLSFFIFASILVARSWPATVSALSGPHCPRPSGRTSGAHISLDPYDHHIVMVRAHHGGTQLGPRIGTQIFVANWDPISVTRDPNVDQYTHVTLMTP